MRRKNKKEYKIKKLVEEGIVEFQKDEEELRILKVLSERNPSQFGLG